MDQNPPHAAASKTHSVEVLEFRNATRFNFQFKLNDEAHWDRIATAIRVHAPDWQHEKPPAQ